MFDWLIKKVATTYVGKATTLNFLGGYKTYIVMIGALVVAVIGLTGGATLIPGVVVIPSMNAATAVGIAWKAIGFITLRKAIGPNATQVADIKAEATKVVERTMIVASNKPVVNSPKPFDPTDMSGGVQVPGV